MNALLAKEIRLLRPVYGIAMLLAIAPFWVLRASGWSDLSQAPDIATWASDVSTAPFALGVVLLALSSFGREFALKTFPLTLAQPMERSRVWWTKIAALAGALATVLAAWFLCSVVLVHAGSNRPHFLRVHLATGAVATMVYFVGGLWTTLLLRQAAAAFWFSLLVPPMLVMFCAGEQIGQTPVRELCIVGFYSLAGFVWAWRHFLRMQETGWTGGVISFPSRSMARTASAPSIRTRRPLAALFWKEIQLHQMSLAGMACLFALHLGAVWLRSSGHYVSGNWMRTALEYFGGLWLVAPLLVGCQSVADERNLGALDGLMALPVSRRLQFGVKFLVALVLGGLLSATLLWAAEGLGTVFHRVPLIAGIGAPTGAALAGWCVIFAALSVVGVYASTLARGIVQAFGIALLILVGLSMLTQTHARGFIVSGTGLRVLRISSPLELYVGAPVLAAAFVWLACRNFGGTVENSRLWRRNLLGLASAWGLIYVLTFSIYHRVWELAAPLEPARGAPRWAGAKRPLFRTSSRGTITFLTPEGGLWVDRLAPDPGRLVLAFGDWTGFRVGEKWSSLDAGPVVSGSNWVDAAASFYETVAIQSDGTLWVSEKPRQFWNWNRNNGLPPVEKPSGLVRFGHETNWRNVVRDYSNLSMFLLKQDGSLWLWGTNDFATSRPWPGLRSFEPHRLGDESDWMVIKQVGTDLYAWKKDGRAWLFHPPRNHPDGRGVEVEPGLVMEPLPNFDHTQWRSLSWAPPYVAGVRDDGTLWVWPDMRERQIEALVRNFATNRALFPKKIRTEPRQPNSKTGLAVPLALQLGRETNWLEVVAADDQRLAMIKADGSLWEWPYSASREFQTPFQPIRPYPVRLGTHHDWAALCSAMGRVIALSADGTLWEWPEEHDFWREDRPPLETGQPMLAASRRPVKIENIFGPEK